jgi:Cu/Ag efflux pump CusA
MKKFVSNLIMFIVFIAIFALVVFIFYETWDETALIIGIPLAIIYAIISFFIKRIRSKMTIWWGILSLASAAWWIYLLTQNI